MNQVISGKIELTPQKKKEAFELIFQGNKKYIPHINITCTIFGFHNNQLQILLTKWRGFNTWALPTGFIKHTETADEAAARILETRTGMNQLFLQQFHTFSDLDLNKFNSRSFLNDYFDIDMELPADNWLLGRILTIGYYALTNVPPTTPFPKEVFEEGAHWWPVDELPPLLFDYDKIVNKALVTLRLHLNFQPIGMNLLPEKFTMPELQKLYETILGKTMDRANFKKKMMAQEILQRLEERVHGGAHMPPFLYKFDAKKYTQVLNDAIS